MKKIMIFAVLMCGFSTAYSQITQEMYDVKVTEIANLIRQLEDADANKNEMIATLQVTINALRDSIMTLRRDLSSLERYKSQQKAIEARFIMKNDSIILLETQLLEKGKQIDLIQQQGDQKAREEKEQGRLEALSNVYDTYKKPFDDLIKLSTKQSAERDLLLVGNDEALRKKLQDLQQYFTAQQVLFEQYSEQKIHAVQAQIDNLEQTALVKSMNVNLSRYNTCNNGLRKTIQEILKIDRENIGNTENARKRKMELISYAISRYFYEYPAFSFNNYPYLTNIIWEIWTRKQKNVDTDISNLLEKL